MSDTVTVLRVGHPAIPSPHGLPAGPFAGYCSVSYNGNEPVVDRPYIDNMWRLPTPKDDGINDFYPGLVCGCADEAQIRAWFGDVLDELEFYGWRVYIYEVPAVWVRRGGHQVAFEPQHAREVAVHPPTKYKREAA